MHLVDLFMHDRSETFLTPLGKDNGIDFKI